MTDLATMAAKLAAPAAMTAFRRLRVSFEVPWRVQRFCRKSLLPVPRYWALRRFLSDFAVLEVFKSAELSRHRDLIAALPPAGLAPAWALSAEQARQLAFGMLTAFTSVISPNEVTQAEVRSQGARLEALYDERDVSAGAAEFDAALNAISRVRAHDARALGEIWPAVRRFVRELSASSDRAQLLTDWVASPPSWMGDTPAPALLWMAGVAEDLGCSTDAFVLIDRALDQGASPAAFWRLRRDMQVVPEDAAQQREALRPHLDTHPIARSITFFLDGDPDAALAELDAFQPSPVEQRYVDFLRCQVLLASGQLETALGIAEAELGVGFTGPAQFVADRLLALGSERTSTIHFAHLSRSLELALRVRDEARAWGGRSSAAALTAVQACELIGDLERALRLTRVAPDGEATIQEAAAPRIEEHRLTMAARVLSRVDAQSVIQGAGASAARVEAEALLAERDGDRTRAATLWQQASDMATEPQDIFRIAFHLAGHGTVAANVHQVDGADPELIADVELLAQLNSGVPGAVETLRGSVHRSRQLVYGLLDHLRSAGDMSLAGKVAAEAGERWADPELWFAAAELSHEAGDYEETVTAANNAQRVARADWPRRRHTRQLLMTALTEIGRWSQAAEVAADLLAETPNEPGARWALVTCQVRLGRDREAWSTFSDFPAGLVPRNPHEMTVRIHLWRNVENSSQSLQEILDLADNWPENRSVKLALVGALLFFTGEVPESLVERVGERVRSIIEEYPDVFIQQTFDQDDVEGFVQRMVDMLPDTSTIDENILNGGVPFGLAAAIHHRRLMEVLAARTGPLFANDARRFDDEVVTARGSRSSDVAIDSTAMMTLTYLDEATATLAAGYVGRLRAPLRQRIDAVASLDSLSSLSTVTVGRAPSGGPAVHQITEDEAVARRERVARTVDLYDSVRIVERTWESTIPEIGDSLDDFVWAEALDVAARFHGTVLWCDDFRVRQFATYLGVASVSTSALIEAMRLDRVLPADIADFSQSVLVSRGLVGGRFNAQHAVGAAELDGWRAAGSASYVAFGPQVSDAAAHIQFVATAMSRNIGTPDAIQQWAHSMAMWLVRAGGEENAQANLVMFLRAILLEPWVTAAEFPYVIAGIRDVTGDRELPDPLEAALRAHFQRLTLTLDHPMASAIVRGLVQYSSADDRTVATQAVMTRG